MIRYEIQGRVVSVSRRSLGRDFALMTLACMGFGVIEATPEIERHVHRLARKGWLVPADVSGYEAELSRFGVLDLARRSFLPTKRGRWEMDRTDAPRFEWSGLAPLGSGKDPQ